MRVLIAHCAFAFIAEKMTIIKSIALIITVLFILHYLDRDYIQ